LRDPGDDGVRLGGILHVAHSEAEGVEIVLDAEKLERVTAIAVDEFALEFAQSGELEGDVACVGEDSEDGDGQAEIEALSGSLLRGECFALGEGYNAGVGGTNSEEREAAAEEVIHFSRVEVSEESVAPPGLDVFLRWTSAHALANLCRAAGA